MVIFCSQDKANRLKGAEIEGKINEKGNKTCPHKTLSYDDSERIRARVGYITKNPPLKGGFFVKRRIL